MHILQTDATYILNSLNKSERPDIKLFYLCRYTEQVKEHLFHTITGKEEHTTILPPSHDTHSKVLDPFWIQWSVHVSRSVDSENELHWSLSQLLYIARVISSDERALWECIGPNFPFCFNEPQDSWTEQKAVKWIRAFLLHRGKEGDDGNHLEWRNENAGEDGETTNDDINSLHRCNRNKSREGGEVHPEYSSALLDELESHAQHRVKPDPFHPSVLQSTNEQNSSLTNETRDPAGDDNAQTQGTTSSCTDCGVTPYTVPSSIEIVPMKGVQEGLIRCKAPLPAFRQLLCVPHEALFCRDTVLQYSLMGRAIHSTPGLQDLDLHEETLLVLCLVFERNVVGEAHSHWRTLLEGCPSQYPFVPSFWELWDLAELEGLDMLDEVLERRNELHAFYERMVAVMPMLFSAVRACEGSRQVREHAKALASLKAFEECFTEEALQWARATFDSRAFYLNMKGETVLTLAPFADMINHCNKSDVLTRRILPNGDFSMEIGAGLTPSDVGREVWMSYGPLQNWELLQYYGFVLDDNEHDKLPFPVQTCRQTRQSLPSDSGARCRRDAPQDQILHSFPNSSSMTGDEDDTTVVAGATNREWERRREELIDKYFLYTLGRCWIGYEGTPSHALLALLRIMVANAEELERMREGTIDPFTPVSEPTEQAIRVTVAETVQCVLHLFSTSLNEDEDSLREQLEDDEEEDNNNSDGEAAEVNYSVERYVLALKLRISLKRIALRCLNWCTSKES